MRKKRISINPENLDMPAHDWSLVDDGIFHDFHQEWLRAIKHDLNDGLLPDGYYALTEQWTMGVSPDVLALQASDFEGLSSSDLSPANDQDIGTTAVMVEPPKVALWGECEIDHYRHKQNAVVVRHSSDDQVVAMIEVVSRGNKSSRKRLEAFVEKITDLIGQEIHQLVLDLHPPGNLDPHGMHAAIWEHLNGSVESSKWPTKPLQMVSYEADAGTRVYLATIEVGEPLPAMPLFLRPGVHVEVPLEESYQRAFAEVPRRWRKVLEPQQHAQ